MLNVRGIDLFWPSPIRVVMPGRTAYRLEVGSKAEMIVLCALLVFCGIVMEVTCQRNDGITPLVIAVAFAELASQGRHTPDGVDHPELARFAEHFAGRIGELALVGQRNSEHVRAARRRRSTRLRRRS